jgi:predicted lipid-binding transport protein (Tim44 family)
MNSTKFNIEAWLSQFPDQELASQIRRIVGDDYLNSPEELLWNAIVAYRKAQETWNLNPENTATLETVAAPIIGTLLDTEQPNIKTQKTAYTVTFVTQVELASTQIMGWQKAKP